MNEPTRSQRGPWLALIGPAALILLWGGVASLHLFPPSLFPHPLDVARGIVIEVRSGRLLDDVVASLFRVTVGFLLAVGLGVPAGLLGLADRLKPGAREAVEDDVGGKH